MSRIDDLLKQMTIEEKISMLAGADLWHTVGIPRLGIPGSSNQASVTVYTPAWPSSVYSVSVTNAQGCAVPAVANILVNAKPVISLAGPDTLCVGEQTNLQPVTGGVWVSLYPDVATIDNSGIITCHVAGISRFLFTNITTGCTSDTSGVIVVLAPTSIAHNPAGNLCPGQHAQLSPQIGGSWTSNQPAVAEITSSGYVTAHQSGAALFSFLNDAGCVSTTTVSYTVHEIPDVLLIGDAEICVGTQTQFLPNTGGSWAKRLTKDWTAPM